MTHDDATIHEQEGNFLEMFQRDRDSGRARTLREYLDLFPKEEEFVARHFVAARNGRGGTPSSGTAGSYIGHYRVIRELGQGGQGVVYLAEDERLKRKVALKVLSSQASEMHLQRFRREAAVTSRLDHPGICAVLDVGTEGTRPFIAMRFVEGETLAARIAKTRGAMVNDTSVTFIDLSLSAEVAGSPTSSAAPKTAQERKQGQLRSATQMDNRQLADMLVAFEQCARALHVAHEAGVVHRDIKPGNIMITRDGQPVVFDFGLARDDEDVSANLTMTGDLFGTPAYMSPEQVAAGRERLDRRTDIWSLGISLFEAATLERPFDAPTRERLYNAIMEKDPPDPRTLNPAIPPDLSVVILTALDKDPDRRYQTCEAFADELRRVRLHEPILARPVSAFGRLVRWGRRNPAIAAALCAVFLSLTIGLVTTLQQKARADENAARAEASLLDWTRLADGRRLEDLIKEADTTLWPAWPDRTRAIETWMARARDLRGRLPDHKRALEALRAHANVAADDAEDRLKLDKLADLVGKLSVFQGEPKPGVVTMHDVEMRLDEARTIEKRSITDPAAKWTEAIAAVAADPRFKGFALTPLMGLVPIGKDPKSGFQEFVDIQSGDAPERKAGESVRCGEETGVVFVLVPGGTFNMGAQSTDDEKPNFDGDARADEGPVHAVTVSPFLISKWEMTQGQWGRLTGASPSQYGPGSKIGDLEHDLAHPVEQVGWDECMATLARIGGVLPTEAQWEYAARGGTSTRWWCGNSPDELEQVANLADDYCKNHGGLPNWTYEAWDDGYTVHAPVGSFSANPFGLHDVHGNVWEWCRDAWGGYDAEPRAGDGLRNEASSKGYVIRGGSFSFRAVNARCSFRSNNAAGTRTGNVGCRPVRLLEASDQ